MTDVDFDPEKFLNTQIYAFDFQFMIGDVKDFLEFSESNIDWQYPGPLSRAQHTGNESRHARERCASFRHVDQRARAGQERDMGSIEPGKLANLLVLSRNPLDDTGDLTSVVMTVKRGHVFKRRDFKPLRKGDITDF